MFGDLARRLDAGIDEHQAHCVLRDNHHVDWRDYTDYYVAIR